MFQSGKISIVINLICIFLISIQVEAQNPSLNMTLLGQWHDPGLPLSSGQRYSDIWGYAANGREYAIMGSIGKIHFFDVTDPEDIIQVGAFEASANSNSIWRDFKTYGQYAYAVADQSSSAEGLLIFDLSNLPTSVTMVNQITDHFIRAHNIYIDTQHGKLYVCGPNTLSNGLIIYDLTIDPVNLAEPALPIFSSGYIHDIHVRNNIGFCSHGTNGLRVYNFSNPNSPVVLGTLNGYIDEGYNHSSWLTADGNHLVFCDENHGRTVKMADVSNYANMTVTDTFKSTLMAPEQTNSIAHNPFVLEDNVFISYYHDGVQVFSLLDPTNVVKVAYFDTDPAATTYGGFRGSWGVYPYLPSGNIIASDMLNGLFVLSLDPIFLPVDLLSFDASVKEEGILLSWEAQNMDTDSEFNLYRVNQNQVLLETIRLQKDVHGSQYFEFLDDAPEPGYNYYRLHIKDKDQLEHKSQIITANWKKEMAFGFYPSILKAGNSGYIQRGTGAGELLVSLMNIDGKIFRQDQLYAESGERIEYKLPVDIPSGFYVITINDLNKTQQNSIRIFVEGN